MSRMLLAIAGSLRAWVRLLQGRDPDVGAASRLCRAILAVPAISLLVLLFRLAAAFGVRISATVAVEGGLRFVCHPPDLIQLYLWLFGVWEPDLTQFIKTRLRPGDGFIDVGANIGYCSTVASRRVGESGRVVAIEASPEVFRSLLETIELNQAGNIRAVNAAAAAKAQTIQVFAGPAHNTGLTTTEPSRGLRPQASIEARPLDDLLDASEIQTARLVKIDVEGGEPSVLAGMPRFLRSCRRDVEILIELSPNWWSDRALTPQQVLQPFVDAGFNVYRMDNNYWPWRYLWPNAIRPCRRVREPLTDRVDRIDIVLSRVDADSL